MLKSYLYINRRLLEQFISQVENGLRRTRETRQTNSTTKSGGVDFKVAKGSGTSESEGESTEHYDDTSEAQFERLLALIAGNEDQFGWLTVLQQSDLASVSKGNTIDVSADIFEPEINKIAGRGGLMEALPLMRQLSALADNTDIPGIPAREQLDAIAAFGSAMSIVVQGEVLDSDWGIVGTLTAEERLLELEGEARVIGKVTRVVAAGEKKPLPGLPIVSQMPRQQRRDFEAKGPSNPGDPLWFDGPAIELEVLAIYR